MSSAALQQSLLLMQVYQTVALQASYRARFAPGSDARYFGVQTGEINLQQLLLLPFCERKAVVEEGPYIDTYLGNTRVYKRTSRTLLFASCPDIGRFLEPRHGGLAICLPEGFSNALAVKLAVLYTEQYLLDPKVRDAPWHVRDDFALYIDLAELFKFIGMSHAARKLETAIIGRVRETSLNISQICQIWSREYTQQPSRYAEAMADNIFTFICMAEIEHFRIEYDTEPTKRCEERIKAAMKREAEANSDTFGKARIRARNEMWDIENLLKAPANIALKQLVWTASILQATMPSDPVEWLEIGIVKARGTASGASAGMRKILLRTKEQLPK